ncbi:holo-ACP synthase [Desulfurobacterium atlanticum]|uniref:Holo-[acyl-carrier-protein] synthase n=1 Tax=Desulfurobacterium atlanticum TaxID=240169 RepID=A0A238XWF4_9BACT|nr:holo-ACP synthase [Desulfurobacterium atlanticum]SNR62773.1 holo-[acyl-carrier protein] synthase [Desulfurobacterium atlanticum]
MIVSCGVDIVSNKRIETVLNKWGDKFLEKVFPEGVDYCRKKRKGEYIGCIAARFALKEAVIKAFSSLGISVSFSDIVIRDGGKNISLSVKGQSFKFLFSISHEKEYSIAFVNVVKES